MYQDENSAVMRLRSRGAGLKPSKSHGVSSAKAHTQKNTHDVSHTGLR